MSAPMIEGPSIVCPSCKKPIHLTESLAAPLIEAARAELEAEAQKRERLVADREAKLQAQLRELEAGKASLEEQVAQKLKQERAALVEVEARKARAALADEIERERAEKAAVEALLKERDQKLAAARDRELEVMKQADALRAREEELELSLQRRLQEEAAKLREDAQKKADEESRLKLEAKDKIISDMQRQVEELRRKGEQGSQQLQGEVLELQLEAQLRAAFPLDAIDPVPKGELGGDVLHRVGAATGQPSGLILWELKNTKAFQPLWVQKLKDNAQLAKADVAILVTTVLPKGISEFGQHEGVWVTSPRYAVPLAQCLRQLLVDVAAAHKANEGLETKMELVYRYLTGPRFQQRLNAIVGGFKALRQDLEREKKAMNAQWAKREKELERVMLASTGMYGDLQGIAGQTIAQIDDLDLRALEAPEDDADDAAS